MNNTKKYCPHNLKNEKPNWCAICVMIHMLKNIITEHKYTPCIEYECGAQLQDR
jgi:hypothetical protein